MTAALAVALVLAMATAAPAFDRQFRQATKRFFGPALDWQWFKAQAMAESSLNPDAVSPVGARGLMQIMPGTSREVAKRLGLPDRPQDPRIAIMLGVAYDRQLWDFWSAPRPDMERLRLMLASYNAGPGNILKAQRQAQAAGLEGAAWEDMAEHLPAVTGRHSTETINYVGRIEAFYQRLITRAIR
jgi:membrane-bound lytic murein transglycosylase F